MENNLKFYVGILFLFLITLDVKADNCSGGEDCQGVPNNVNGATAIGGVIAAVAIGGALIRNRKKSNENSPKKGRKTRLKLEDIFKKKSELESQIDENKKKTISDSEKDIPEKNSNTRNKDEAGTDNASQDEKSDQQENVEGDQGGKRKNDDDDPPPIINLPLGE